MSCFIFFVATFFVTNLDYKPYLYLYFLSIPIYISLFTYHLSIRNIRTRLSDQISFSDKIRKHQIIIRSHFWGMHFLHLKPFNCLVAFYNSAQPSAWNSCIFLLDFFPILPILINIYISKNFSYGMIYLYCILKETQTFKVY